MKQHRIELKEAKESIMFIDDDNQLYVYVLGCQYKTNIKGVIFFNEYIYLSCSVSIKLAKINIAYRFL